MEQPLPQTRSGWFVTDGGIETTLIFQDGIELPEFAAFVLLDGAAGRDALRRYYQRYLAIAAGARGAGFILESPTWRAGLDWGRKLGYDERTMQRFNLDAVALMHELRDAWAARIDGAIVVSGCVGPRGDGYLPGAPMSGHDAMQAHLPQVRALGLAHADMITAVTMTTSGEAIGVARAAAQVGLPCAISFTVETDGRLPSGQELREAIEQVDAGTAPAYFMINCAHPTHFAGVLEEDGGWRERIGGLRANASRMSHAELDEAEQLDDGNPAELGAEHGVLRERLPGVCVLGGCCGTDARHVREVATAWSR
jgi:S-methylmethionine-dependent homocysteine/selenocysteine methylase